MRRLVRRRPLSLVLACVVLGAWAPSALGATPVFHPRVRNALGLAPPVTLEGNLAAGPGAQVPVTYHGGSVMSGGVTIHLIFWAPSGYAFQGSPGAGIPSYQQMIEQYFTDVAADSGPAAASNCSTPSGECNVFSTLTQYGSQSGTGSVTSGNYSVSFSAANPNDVILDTNPYPAQQCTSPQSTKACILDGQVQAEVDKIAAAHGNGRGLNNLWYVFTPPDVDECITAGVCETNAFGGYHSLSSINGHGLTIYAYTGDPIVETRRVLNPGADPNGNPDAELVVDIAAHETNEAMTDPEGVGWMDPNGFEVADKCEFGPQYGTPLGSASNGSPFNQVINGHQYLTQEMWSNDGGQGNSDQNCVQGTTSTNTGLPLPRVNLTQFSGTVTGNIEHATAGVSVKVTLLRGSDGTQVAQASGTTDANGNWTATLSHPVGDDRDEIDIDYSGTGAPTPSHQVILTGNGGNPFTESGWTGWTALDQGAALTNNDPVTSGPSLSLAPCFQTGVETYTIAGVAGTQSPTDFCQGDQVADVSLAAPVTKGQLVTYSTNDNRAFQPPDAAVPNGAGGLVHMTVNVGEPDSVAAFPSSLLGFNPTGFPICTGDLGAQAVGCTGLVPGESYTITDGTQSQSATADPTGTAIAALSIKGGDHVALLNGSRTLTTLHVAHLRVSLIGNDAAVVLGGTCEPDQYWGGPLTTAPTNLAAGEPSVLAGGSALTGSICPASGDPTGLPTDTIAQTDEQSGGTTQTEVAGLLDTSPMEGETMYGAFTALAEATDGSSPIALTITHAAGGSPVFKSPNVDTAHGVHVKALTAGTYTATWKVYDSNGDTRTVTTRFVEQSALLAPAGTKPHISCKLVRHHKIRCKVTFKSSKKGTLLLSLTHGSSVAALGHGRLSHGSATVTMRELHGSVHGHWTITLVIERGRTAQTIRAGVSLA